MCLLVVAELAKVLQHTRKMFDVTEFNISETVPSITLSARAV
jgi:hypothetical protein